MAKRQIFGLEFDTDTGKVFLADGSPPAVGADFTFENVIGYNPLQYATEETTNKIVSLLEARLPKDVVVMPVKTIPEGPIQPPVQHLIHVSRFGIGDDFNAGLIANSIIRTGSLSSFLNSLKDAGILF